MIKMSPFLLCNPLASGGFAPWIPLSSPRLLAETACAYTSPLFWLRASLSSVHPCLHDNYGNERLKDVRRALFVTHDQPTESIYTDWYIRQFKWSRCYKHIEINLTPDHPTDTIKKETAEIKSQTNTSR